MPQAVDKPQEKDRYEMSECVTCGEDHGDHSARIKSLEQWREEVKVEKSHRSEMTWNGVLQMLSTFISAAVVLYVAFKEFAK